METEVVAPAKGKMSPVLIIVLVLVGLCLLGCLISICLAIFLPGVMAPILGSQLNDLSTQIALTLTP